MNEEKEEALPKGQTLVSYIEWEDFGHRWKIDKLEPSESLPQGAARAEVWRDEDYQLKAKIAGTSEGSHIDLHHPDVEAGSLIPLFEIIGSDEWGLTDYEIGSCVVGNVLSSEVKAQDKGPTIADYEADLYTLGARWSTRDGNPAEAEWLSEWYLNGPDDPRMYPRGSVTQLMERYKRERNLPGNEENNFEEIKQLGGTRFAFVETDGLSFLVQHTPKNLGPSWSGCVSIEYRPNWGGIPDANVREAIAAVTSFLLGRELVNVGHTKFTADGLPISQVAINPQKDNLMSLCQREDMRTPVEIDTFKAEGGIETLLRQFVPSYLNLLNELRINEALRCYWLSRDMPVGLNLPVLGAGLETLASSWFESRRSKTKGVYMPKGDFDALLGEELGSAETKLESRQHGVQILNRLGSAYNMGANDRLQFFFDEIGLSVGEVEWWAIRQRNPMAHGAASVFDGSTNERMIRATDIYRTLFHRIVLKLLGYDGVYVDHGTLGYPIRDISEPSGT